MEHCHLPLEVVELIIACMVPDRHLALPPYSTETKTLYSCLFLCKGIVPFVQELLYRSCLYVDNPLQVRHLVRSYSIETPLSLRKPRKIDATQKMLLSPFSRHTILEPDVVSNLSLLFQTIGSNLKHLTIDMPLRSNAPLDPEDENEDNDPDPSPIRIQLRAAFKNLTALEELVSIQDELYLASTSHLRSAEPQVWPTYASLKRLALYNTPIDIVLISGLQALPSLKSLILTRLDSDGVEGFVQLTHLQKPSLKILIVNAWEDLESYFWDLSWYPRTSISPQDVNPDEFAKIRILCVEDAMGVPRRLRGEMDEITVCQKWIRDNVLNGKLWDYEGVQIDRSWRELNNDQLYA